MRFRTLLLGGSMLLLAAAPTGALATAPAGGGSYTLEARLWDCQVSGGQVGGDVDVSITLKRANGTVVGTEATHTSGLGTWYASFCDAPSAGRIRPGDRITIKRSAALQRTITVPDVQPRINVPANVVTVPRDPDTTDIEVQVVPCTAGDMCQAGIPFIPTGTPYTVDTDPTDIRSGDRIQLDIAMDSGLERWLVDAPAPFIAVRNGSATVTGAGKPGTTVDLTLRSSGGKVRGTASVKASGPNGTFSGTIRKNGTTVKVQAGDKVSASIYTGAKIQTVAGSLGVDKTTGAVTGSCFANAQVLVSARSGAASATALKTTDGVGGFTFSATNFGLPVPSGTRVEARCENAQGNQQILVATVP